jgi:hypothetical protein
MYTDQRRDPNFFVPDANHVFHVLSVCDGMMNSTHRFTQSSPAWLPIVSQLYISVLWNFFIVYVYNNAGYGLEFSQLVTSLISVLRLDESPIPGPLVPFFESLAAVNGPFTWIGDVMSALPDLPLLWDQANFVFTPDYFRSVPCPAVLLDQLQYFATWVIPQNQQIYTNFEWYRNIFSVPVAVTDLRRYRLAPNCSGSLYSTNAQVDAARAYWNPYFTGQPRTNVANPPFHDWSQIFGFSRQNDASNITWWQHVSSVMAKYCQYFNGSKTLKTLSPTGTGSVLVSAIPQTNQGTRDWLYPAAFPQGFLSSRFAPIHELPDGLRLMFNHSDHELEEVAEQYAILTATNVVWFENNAAQHGFARVQRVNTHRGTYWVSPPHRRSGPINLKVQYAQVIASRYHQVSANKVE